MGIIVIGQTNDHLHATTNYECYKGFYSSLNDNNLFEIAYALNRQFGQAGIYRDLDLYNFVDNHDVNRIASQLNQPLQMPLLYALLFAAPGIPSIYYGSEWGITGKREKNSDISCDRPWTFRQYRKIQISRIYYKRSVKSSKIDIIYRH